ncbi:hypothetical protein [Kitasatospora sp. NPDC101183]|uniref:hypothetical protein n=1 Tax=Kitasatospora sp. NPDC101183 TaxID=3364100 RepID=UPI00380DEECB
MIISLKARTMSKGLLTVCLPPTPPDEVEAAIAAAMAPYDYAEQTGGSAWQGEWDSWHIYGGYDGDGFLVSPANEADPRLIFHPTGPRGITRQRTPSRWDGGPRALLDFHAARAPVATRAAERWQEWHTFAARFPPALPFEDFIARARQDLVAYPVAQARDDYYEQPLIKEANESHEVCRLSPLLSDPIDYFGDDQAKFVRSETERVIPTNHLLLLDGRWIDGTLEDWGRDLGESGDYHRFANEYLETLPGDCLVIRLSFHY